MNNKNESFNSELINIIVEKILKLESQHLYQIQPHLTEPISRIIKEAVGDENN